MGIMKTRGQYIDLIRVMPENETFSASQLAEYLDARPGTVNGWLSDRGAFPPIQLGIRRSRIYSIDTLKRLIIYMFATNEGIGLASYDARQCVGRFSVDEMWEQYCLGIPALSKYLLSKKESGGLE